MRADPWISVRSGRGRIRGTLVTVAEVVEVFMRGVSMDETARRLGVPYEAVDAAIRWNLRRVQRRRVTRR